MTDEQKIKYTLTVRGDCGRIHPSLEDWKACKTCGAVLERRLTWSKPVAGQTSQVRE